MNETINWGRDVKCRFCKETCSEAELDSTHGGCNDCMSKYYWS